MKEEHRTLDERKKLHQDRKDDRADQKQEKADKRAASDGQVTEADLVELRLRMARLEREIRRFSITSADARVTVSGSFPHFTIKVRT